MQHAIERQLLKQENIRLEKETNNQETKNVIVNKNNTRFIKKSKAEKLDQQ
jgi:hypothetical protein